MTTKVYYNSKPVYITELHYDKLKHALPAKGTAFMQTGQNADWQQFIKEIEDDSTKSAYLYGQSVEESIKELSAQFEHIEAAGGIIQNDKKEILFIYRLGKWDLPKGKVEKNENKRDAAAREIEEETGLKNLQIKYKVGKTYHIYHLKNRAVFKTTHWYYFTVKGSQELVPQTAEDISEVRWFSTKDIRIPAGNTYENIKDILSSFFDTP